MSKFKPVLSDDELWAAASEVEWQGTIGQYRLIEQAVQAKLADQHTPTAWLNEETGDVISSELKDDAPEMLKGYDVPLYTHPMPCVSESAKSDTQHHLSHLKLYQKWRRGEDKTMSEMGLTPKLIGEALDWLIRVAENYIADVGEVVTPDGWQLVPIEPTDEMLVSGQEEWALGKRGAMEDCEESRAIFKAMLAAAPKYNNGDQ